MTPKLARLEELATEINQRLGKLEWDDALDCLFDNWRDETGPDDILDLINKLKVAREALEFYANDCGQCSELAPCHQGQHARKALAAIDNES